MVVEITQTNAQTGDKKEVIDTHTKRSRRRLKGIIQEKKTDGAAIFAIVGEHYRVEDYDPNTDELIVRPDRPNSRKKRVPAAEAQIHVIAPSAGG